MPASRNDQWSEEDKETLRKKSAPLTICLTFLRRRPIKFGLIRRFRVAQP